MAYSYDGFIDSSILSDVRAYSHVDMLPREICGIPVDRSVTNMTVEYDKSKDLSVIKCIDGAGEVVQTINVTGGMSIDHSYGGPPIVTAAMPHLVTSSGTHVAPSRRGTFTPKPRIAKSKYAPPVAPVLTSEEVQVSRYYANNFVMFAHFDPKRDCMNHIVLIQAKAMTEEQLRDASGVLYEQDYKRYAPGTGTVRDPHPFDSVDTYHHILLGYTRLDVVMKGDLDDFLSSLGV